MLQVSGTQQFMKIFEGIMQNQFSYDSRQTHQRNEMERFNWT